VVLLRNDRISALSEVAEIEISSGEFSFICELEVESRLMASASGADDGARRRQVRIGWLSSAGMSIGAARRRGVVANMMPRLAHGTEKWLRRRDLPWRTYIRRPFALPSLDYCR
jgi:hypothetical protein